MQEPDITNVSIDIKIRLAIKLNFIKNHIFISNDISNLIRSYLKNNCLSGSLDIFPSTNLSLVNSIDPHKIAKNKDKLAKDLLEYIFRIITDELTTNDIIAIFEKHQIPGKLVELEIFVNKLLKICHSKYDITKYQFFSLSKSGRAYRWLLKTQKLLGFIIGSWWFWEFGEIDKRVRPFIFNLIDEGKILNKNSNLFNPSSIIKEINNYSNLMKVHIDNQNIHGIKKLLDLEEVELFGPLYYSKGYYDLKTEDGRFELGQIVNYYSLYPTL